MLGLGLKKGGSYKVTKARKREEELLMRLMVSLRMTVRLINVCISKIE